jgi:hypothetical protein
MTIKRLILSMLTVVAILFAGTSLLESLRQPQIQSRLELYQTNLYFMQPSGNQKQAKALNSAAPAIP